MICSTYLLCYSASVTLSAVRTFYVFLVIRKKKQKDGKDAESFISSAAADEVSEQTEVPESCRRRSCNLLLTHLIHVAFLPCASLVTCENEDLELCA